MYKRKLGIFARCPVPGKAKTRLCPPLTETQACELYRSFIIDVFARLESHKKLSLTVFHSDPEPGELSALAPARARLMPQSGKDLGERMNSALINLLDDRQSAGAVLIGTDSPDIPLPYIKRAFVKLKHHDVVLGPASDGGYYLVGVKSPQPRLFQGVSWGTGTVFARTIANAQEARLSVAVLPLWYDVDDEHSLRLLAGLTSARIAARSLRLPHVESALADLKL